MKSTLRSAALIVLLVLSVGCDSPPPGSPDDPLPPPPTNPTPLSGPSRTFVFHSELTYPVRDHTKQSRFVLYDNGAFEFRYPHVADGTYRGTYEDNDGVVAFYQVDGSVVVATWGATGRLSNSELTVNFNDESEQADFEDAIYVLMP